MPDREGNGVILLVDWVTAIVEIESCPHNLPSQRFYPKEIRESPMELTYMAIHIGPSQVYPMGPLDGL